MEKESNGYSSIILVAEAAKGRESSRSGFDPG